jgi:hypothetical protein
MWRRSFRFSSARGLALAALAAVGTSSSRAQAQACCAGGSAVTPARLELHEQALAGVELRAGGVLGAYDPGGHYGRNPSGDTELDFEQDLFGAFRFLRRGQFALLVPLVETQRQTRQDGGHIGGGIGDVNASVRYDFVVAGESYYVPGIALLAGATLPTGTAPESATAPLAVDATGIAAKRTARFGQTLGTQVTLLAAGAYTFDNDAAVALSVAYAFEGDASAGGTPVADSSKRLSTFSLSVLWPLGDLWRLSGGLYVEPPISGFGTNQPSVSGLTLTVIRSWS